MTRPSPAPMAAINEKVVTSSPLRSHPPIARVNRDHVRLVAKPIPVVSITNRANVPHLPKIIWRPFLRLQPTVSAIAEDFRNRPGGETDDLRGRLGGG